MRFVFLGSQLCTWASFRQPLTVLPLPSASGYFPDRIEFSHSGLSPHKLIPMSGVHRPLQAARSPAGFARRFLGLSAVARCRGSRRGVTGNLGTVELRGYRVIALPMAIAVFLFEQRKERENEDEEVYQLLSDNYQDFLKVAPGESRPEAVF